MENCLCPGTSTREVRETFVRHETERWNRVREFFREGANFLSEILYMEDVEENRRGWKRAEEEKLNGVIRSAQCLEQCAKF